MRPRLQPCAPGRRRCHNRSCSHSRSQQPPMALRWRHHCRLALRQRSHQGSASATAGGRLAHCQRGDRSAERARCPSELQCSNERERERERERGERERERARESGRRNNNGLPRDSCFEDYVSNTLSADVGTGTGTSTSASKLSAISSSAAERQGVPPRVRGAAKSEGGDIHTCKLCIHPLRRVAQRGDGR